MYDLFDLPYPSYTSGTGQSLKYHNKLSVPKSLAFVIICCSCTIRRALSVQKIMTAYMPVLVICKIQKNWCTVTVHGANNRAPRWTFTDPCKPEVIPGAREESASPAWLAASAMNARDTTNVYMKKRNRKIQPISKKCGSWPKFAYRVRDDIRRTLAPLHSHWIKTWEYFPRSLNRFAYTSLIAPYT